MLLLCQQLSGTGCCILACRHCVPSGWIQIQSAPHKKIVGHDRRSGNVRRATNPQPEGAHRVLFTLSITGAICQQAFGSLRFKLPGNRSASASSPYLHQHKLLNVKKQLMYYIGIIHFLEFSDFIFSIITEWPAQTYSSIPLIWDVIKGMSSLLSCVHSSISICSWGWTECH